MEESYDMQKLLKRANQLTQQRRDLLANMKLLYRRKRFITDSLKQHSGVVQPPKNGSAEVPKQSKPVGNGSTQPHHPHLNTQEEQIKKIVESQNSIKDRNKRLFGGLNGYLKKAQKRLKEEEDQVKEKRGIEDKAVQKEKEISNKMQQEKLKETEAQLLKLVGKKGVIEEQLLQLQNSILKHKFIAYVADRQTFLETKHSPPIHWKPKNYNPALTALQEKRKNTLRAQSEKIMSQIMSYRPEKEYNTELLQNEKEYYNNILDEYFEKRTPFMLTKTMPRLFWVPGPGGVDKVTEQRTKMKKMWVQEGSKIKQQNNQHYAKFEKAQEPEEQIEENDSESQ